MTLEKIKNVSELSPQPEECVLQYNSVTKPSREKKKKTLTRRNLQFNTTTNADPTTTRTREISKKKNAVPL